MFGRLEAIGGLYRLTVSVDNQASADGMTAEDALRRSLVGTHLIIETGPPAAFVSVIDPPADAREAAGHCQQLRCWPVLAGEAGVGAGEAAETPKEKSMDEEWAEEPVIFGPAAAPCSSQPGQRKQPPAARV